MIADNVGIVVEYDKNSLKDGLIRILVDDELREKFEARCSDFVEEYFNIHNVIDSLESIYLNSRKQEL